MTASENSVPAAVLVPCECRRRVGGEIVHQAVEAVASCTADVEACSAHECQRDTKSFVVAVDA